MGMGVRLARNIPELDSAKQLIFWLHDCLISFIDIVWLQLLFYQGSKKLSFHRLGVAKVHGAMTSVRIRMKARFCVVGAWG